MNLDGIEIMNMMFEMFSSALIFFAGLLTYLFRNEPNTAIWLHLCIKEA